MSSIRDYEQELYKKYQSGDDSAKMELLKSLAPIINSQVNRFATSGLPTTAIRLEAQKLTIGALKTYDPAQAQLSTHVVNNLKKLSRFVTNYQNVGHIPEPRALLIGKYKTINENLKIELGRDPTAVELSEALKVSPLEIDRLQTELRSDLSSTADTLSDDGFDDDVSGFYQYVLPGQADPKLQEAIDFVYFDSDPVDKKILEYSLGLYGTTIKKAKDIAIALKMTDAELKRRRGLLAQKIKSILP